MEPAFRLHPTSWRRTRLWHSGSCPCCALMLDVWVENACVLLIRMLYLFCYGAYWVHQLFGWQQVSYRWIPCVLFFERCPCQIFAPCSQQECVGSPSLVVVVFRGLCSRFQFPVEASPGDTSRSSHWHRLTVLALLGSLSTISQKVLSRTRP